jgi:sec-independent protein translocase protein TatC
MSTAEALTAGRKPFKVLVLLRDIKGTLFRSAIAVVITTALSFLFARQIFDFFTTRAAGMSFYNYELAGMITTYFSVCLYSGFILAAPYIIFELLHLIAPYLESGIRRYLYVTIPVMLLLFLVGAAYTYYVFMPPAFKILFADWGMGVTPQINILSYISFVSKSLLWIGLLFEIPVLVYFLAKLRIVHPHTLLKKWRWAVMGSVLIAAVITPTGNPVQQKMYDIIVMDTGFVVSVPILLLYFSSVLTIWLVQRNDIPAMGKS